MKKDDFSSYLMDKLAGELSENQSRELDQFLNTDKDLQKDYQFFSSAWAEMDDQFEDAEPSNRLSKNFYRQLAEVQQQEEKSFQNRWSQLREQLFSVSPLSRNLSFGLFLVALGFIVGGKLNKQTIQVNQNFTATAPAEAEQFAMSTQKIQHINALYQQNGGKSVEELKEIIENETNTNVRLAALHCLTKQTNASPSLRRFYIQQLEKEQSPLLQVELLNSIIETSKTKESITTMESMLAKQRLNPIVQEKIKKDLPVLRASYVQ